MSRPIGKLLPRHTNSLLASVLILIPILLVVMAIGTPAAVAIPMHRDCTPQNRAGENSTAAVLLRLAQSPQTAELQREKSLGRYDLAMDDTLAPPRAQPRPSRED